MGMLSDRKTEIQAQLDETAAKHGIPGLALGLLIGDETLDLGTVVVDIDTGVAATPDTIFHIGSITKMYTATVVMQLLAQGLIDLRAPITTYLPELRLKQPAGITGITVLHLLTHTSGIEGDTFFDTGGADGALEKLVARLDQVGLIHAPGQMWSYCNTGFVLAGRIIEKITGLPWHRALDTMLVKPLGIETPVTLSDDIARFRAAAGHTPNAETGSLERTSMMRPLSHAPAGLRSFARVGDVLRFARLHLDGGQAAGGARLLPEDMVGSMQDHHAAQPLSLTRGQGIGWFRLSTEPELVLVHIGEVRGFAALLAVAPKRRFALVSMTNVKEGFGANAELGFWASVELAGITPELPGQRAAGASPPPDDLSPLAGTYRRLGAVVKVTVDGPELVVQTNYEGPLEGETPTTARVRPISATVFVDSAGGGFPSEFLDFDDQGRPRYFQSELRAHGALSQTRRLRTPRSSVRRLGLPLRRHRRRRAEGV